MKRNRNRIFAAVVAGSALSLSLTSCTGNNSDLPKEERYQNTTLSAPEATDNLTGYGNITDSTTTDSVTQDADTTGG